MNRIIRCGISLLIVVSLLCACQAATAPSAFGSELAVSSVPAVESQVQAENAPITTEQLLEDYDYLWTALEENYVFFPILEQQGVDVSAIQTDTRNLIQNQVPDVSTFYETLRQMFLKCNYFAHLDVVSKDVYDSMARYYCAEGQEDSGWKDALEKENVRRFYENAPANASELTAPNPAASETIRAEYDAQRKAMIITIRSFAQEKLEQDRQYLQDFFQSHAEDEVSDIVFDITHNRGGSTLYWNENIVAPFGGSYTWDTWLYVRDTALTRQYLADEQAYQPMEQLPEDHPAPEFVSELGLTDFCHYTECLNSDATLPDNLLSAKRWVLVDDAVYSAAESFTYFCKKTGWATLVGTATDGDGLGVTPIMVDLPNTGILVRFSAQVGENPDGTCNTASGTKPDYTCKRFESPLSAFARIRSEE